ncbi:MAG: hypothetical protein QXJ27_01630 [Thermoplasmata archaeon]
MSSDRVELLIAQYQSKIDELNAQLAQLNEEIAEVERARDKAATRGMVIALVVFVAVIGLLFLILGIYGICCLLAGIVFLVIFLALQSGKKKNSFFTGQYDRQLDNLYRQRGAIINAIEAENAKILELQQARNLEIAGRFEEAAQIYERHGLYEEAGNARKKGRTIYVDQKVTELNLNELVNQIRAGGITTIYQCPACKAPIRISGTTSLSSLAKCEYCGSEIKVHDLVEFLRQILGR